MKESMHTPFKRMPGFPAPFYLAWMDGILVDFHSHMLYGLLFPSSDSPGCGACSGTGTPYFSGGTSAAEISLPILNHQT